MSNRPDFFIIGAPKSGTTSLYDYLAGHPDVFMAAVKEPFYFSPDVSTGPRRRYIFGEDDAAYLQLFADAGTAKRLGEASTTYLVSPAAPGLLKSFASDAKLIAMLRNPVDVVHALHNERVSQGVEDISDFASALAADDDRRAGRRLPAGSNALGAVYRDTAMFGEQLARWFAQFDPTQVHVLIFDDFVADPAGQFRGVLSFLGVDETYRPPTFEARNVSHRLRGGSVQVLRDSRLAAFVRRRLLPGLLGEDRSARIARRFRHSRLVRQPNPRTALPFGLRHGLEDEFLADVEQLSRLVGRDLGSLWFGRPVLA